MTPLDLHLARDAADSRSWRATTTVLLPVQTDVNMDTSMSEFRCGTDHYRSFRWQKVLLLRLDVGAQQIVEKYVNGFNDQNGCQRISVLIVMKILPTGEILAMDGGDRYDLNNPRDLSQVYITGQRSMP